MSSMVEKVLINQKGKVVGALLNFDGVSKVYNNSELAQYKRTYGNPSNAVITYDGRIVSKIGNKRIERVSFDNYT